MKFDYGALYAVLLGGGFVLGLIVGLVIQFILKGR
jgi:hypothetical protein